MKQAIVAGICKAQTRSTRFTWGVTLVLALASTLPAPPVRAQASAGTDQILHAADLDSLAPKSVFFRGQTASTQLRNSGGVKFADGMFFFATLVDTSGYSTSVKAKYQGYLITEVPIEIAGKHLSAGAYGVGFIADNQFVVMDIGAHDLITATDERDDKLRRPTPLQVVGDEKAGTYRLYQGREFVTVKRVAE